VLLAGASAVTAGVLFFVRGNSTGERGAFRRLVKAAPTAQRRLEARLTGGFRWAPFRPPRVQRGGEKELPDTSLAHAAADVLGTDSRAASARHAAGVAFLLMGNAVRAAADLRDATADDRSGDVWSDLAAAQYDASIEEQAPEKLVDALVAADAAVAIAPTHPEAHFNRALIVEKLGLTDLAIAAWQRYLELDGTSGWALDARTHLSTLSSMHPRFREELERVYDRIAIDRALARDLDRRFPQEVRTWGETEILGRWAEATRRGEAPNAVRHLAVARVFAELKEARGDGLLAATVNAIVRAGPAQRTALAAAHDDFRQAQRVFMQMKPGEAEPLFERAAEGFDAGGSPVAILARYFRANTAFEQRRTEEAAAALDHLLAATPASFRSARAQIEWELGLCRAAEGRYGEALTTVDDALQTFETLGETDHAATMRQVLAWIHELIGDLPTAWHLRLAALPEVARANGQITQATLSAIAQTATLRQEWNVAASFSNLELEAAQRARSNTFIADASLRRTLVRHYLGRGDSARADMAQARIATAQIADAGMRSQLEGRLWWVEGVLAPSPREKIAALDRAIAFHEAHVWRMNLPALFYERALARRAGENAEGAARDLEAAIAELESHRASLPRGDARWGVFHAAEEIFDEAIDLDLAAGATDAAFRHAERARARTLLDALRAKDPLSPAALPASSAIVEYAALPSKLVIFVVNRSRCRVFSHSIRHADLQRHVESFQLAVASGEEKAIRQGAEILYGLLIAPAASSIPPRATIVAVPDLTLRALPFAALVGPGGRYLIEDHPIVVAPSAVAYERIAGHRRDGARGRALIVVNDEPSGRERLVEAAAEAAKIARMYPRAALLGGKEATPEGFAREARGATMIHFSGHALMSEQRAEDTFLVLSDGAGRERRLGVRNIAALPLEHAPVVVLAACSTARGRATPLEGTMSAAWAFLAAGARSVVATLWPVDDREAADFFTLLHSRLLRGDDPADALRAAQMESIRTSVSPSMWAAVQLTGS